MTRLRTFIIWGPGLSTAIWWAWGGNYWVNLTAGCIGAALALWTVRKRP